MPVIAEAEFISSQAESANPPEPRPPKSAEQYRLEGLVLSLLVVVVTIIVICSAIFGRHRGQAPQRSG